MKRSYRSLVLVCSALLAGCQNSQPAGSAAGPLPAQAAHSSHDANGSWMLAEAKSDDLVYVSDNYNGIVDVYEYGKSKQVGALRGFDEPTGQCVDRDGDVWIVEYFGYKVTEFAHGDSKPIRVLKTDGWGEGCSVNPKNGDLAVGNTYVSQERSSDIQVFSKSSKTPANYYSGAGSSDCADIQAPGYDDKGNLFFLAAWGNSGEGMCELPAGGKALVQVPSSPKNRRLKIDHPGSTMWDGKHITFEDYRNDSSQNSIIYQAVVSGSRLSIVGSTTLGAASSSCHANIESPFIAGNKNTPRNRRLATLVIGGTEGCKYLFGYWPYPAGGTPFKETYGPTEIGGASVSLIAK
ncbi:MAG: hypothetical protein WBD57_13345 [Candidatus Cybelea sp.]